MPLFVARHRHLPGDCPVSPGRGALLLSRISAEVAACYGVTIQAEALLEGEHTLLLVVQAASPRAVRRFLAFLPGPDDLQVETASSAEEAVERGGCGPAGGQARPHIPDASVTPISQTPSCTED